MTDRERRIRELAYRIWEEDGRPEGQEARHWAESERRYAAELGSAPPPKEKAAKQLKAPKAALADTSKAKAAGSSEKVDAKAERIKLKKASREKAPKS